MQYNKPAISKVKQIQLLESRGLIIENHEMAEHFLSQISYYRLAGYWWPLQADKQTHTFKEGSRFQTVIDLYNFDRELRLIVFNMVERIEISIRTHLIYHLSMSYTPWWFENKDLFSSVRHWQANLKSLDKEVRRSKEVFMQKHQEKYYSDGRRPPAWKSFEVISLGLLSKFYAALKNSVPEKKTIAKELKAGNHTFLVSWLHSLTVIRNICAHHSRLWNRNLPSPPRLLDRAPLPWINNSAEVEVHSFYAIFICLYYLLQTISPENQFKARFQELLKKFPNVDPTAMGFPRHWEQEPLWQS